MLAAIFYGVGGGLIVDEIWLLLTFGDYWSGLIWNFFIFLLSFVSFLRARAIPPGTLSGNSKSLSASGMEG